MSAVDASSALHRASRRVIRASRSASPQPAQRWQRRWLWRATTMAARALPVPAMPQPTPAPYVDVALSQRRRF